MGKPVASLNEFAPTDPFHHWKDVGDSASAAFAQIANASEVRDLCPRKGVSLYQIVPEFSLIPYSNRHHPAFAHPFFNPDFAGITLSCIAVCQGYNRCNVEDLSGKLPRDKHRGSRYENRSQGGIIFACQGSDGLIFSLVSPHYYFCVRGNAKMPP